jgi:hypothetical protein
VDEAHGADVAGRPENAASVDVGSRKRALSEASCGKSKKKEARHKMKDRYGNNHVHLSSCVYPLSSIHYL